MASSYRGDPRWIEVRYSGECGKCDGQISKGSRAWWYPRSRVLYCEACGETDARVFASAVADEDLYRGGRL